MKFIEISTESLNLRNWLLALSQVRLDNKGQFFIAAKSLQFNFYIDEFIKPFEQPQQVVEVFNQLSSVLSQHWFELKKKVSKSEIVNKTITEG